MKWLKFKAQCRDCKKISDMEMFSSTITEKDKIYQCNNCAGKQWKKENLQLNKKQVSLF